jgi:hypothetical protein
MPVPTLDLPPPSARPSKDSDCEVVDEGLLRYATENSCYQSMLQRRPVRKCWWEMVSVSTSLEELQRLKDLVPKVEPVTPGIRPSSSLRNLVNISKEKSKERVKEASRKCMESLGSVERDEPKSSDKGPPMRQKGIVKSASNLALGGEEERARGSRIRKGEVEMSIEIKCWVRKTWLAEFVQV